MSRERIKTFVQQFLFFDDCLNLFHQICDMNKLTQILNCQIEII